MGSSRGSKASRATRKAGVESVLDAYRVHAYERERPATIKHALFLARQRAGATSVRVFGAIKPGRAAFRADWKAAHPEQ